MENPETTQDTQDEDKQNKNTTQCDENAYGYLYSYEKDYKMFCFD